MITADIENLRKIAAEGAGAIILKSVCEEQINRDTSYHLENFYPEEAEYLQHYVKAHAIQQHIDLIKKAKLVLNTSFHGTAFSVIYGVPFYYVALSDGWDLRATSLLGELNLKSRILSLEECSADICQNQLDYSQSYELLASLQERSKQFLLNNI